MNTNLLIYIVFGALVVLAVWLVLMEIRLRKLFRGKKAENLEDILKNFGEDLKNLQAGREKTEAYLKKAEERLRRSLKKVGVVRFNPFGDVNGNNQSFSIAFLDESGSGAVISCLYTRDNIKVYAKPVKEYKSEYTLTPEENKAIEKTYDDK